MLRGGGETFPGGRSNRVAPPWPVLPASRSRQGSFFAPAKRRQDHRSGEQLVAEPRALWPDVLRDPERRVRVHAKTQDLRYLARLGAGPPMSVLESELSDAKAHL